MLSVINAVQCLENPDFLMWYNACMLRPFFKTTVSFWNIHGEALPSHRGREPGPLSLCGTSTRLPKIWCKLQVCFKSEEGGSQRFNFPLTQHDAWIARQPFLNYVHFIPRSCEHFERAVVKYTSINTPGTSSLKFWREQKPGIYHGSIWAPNNNAYRFVGRAKRGGLVSGGQNW